MLATETPFPQYFSLAGVPLTGGYLYFGTVGANPETSPIPVYWDEAGTQPATQPIRTVGGYAARSGTPAKLYVSGSYALTVKDARRQLIATSTVNSLEMSLAAAGLSSGAAMIGYVGGAVAAVDRTVQDKLREVVSVKDFGAVGDGVTDDTAAIQAALNYAATIVETIITNKVDVVTAKVYVPAGLYKTSQVLLIGEGTTFEGASQSTSIIKPSHTGIAIQMGGASREYSQIRLRNIGVIGNRSGTLAKGSWTTTTTVGIYAENCIRECSIQDCFVTQCQTSIQAEKSYAFEINQNYLIYALNYHILWDNAVAGRISGNRIDWSEQHGVYLNGGIAADETLSLEVSSNAIQICWKNALWLYDVSSATVTNNFFEGNYREATSDVTRVYADINIETGPNNRGYSFNLIGNFFTHGSSPNFDSYTAIRCNRAQALVCIGNTCRDSRYWRVIDASSVNVQRIVALGNTFVGTFTKIVYDSSVTFGLIEEQVRLGAITIPQLTTGSFQRGATVSSSNQTTDLYRSIYLIDCSGGARTLTLRDADCEAGREYILKKTTGDANSITVAREGGSTKTIDGAASQALSTAYAVLRVGSNGTNWFLL